MQTRTQIGHSPSQHGFALDLLRVFQCCWSQKRRRARRTEGFIAGRQLGPNPFEDDDDVNHLNGPLRMVSCATMATRPRLL